jgi:hypothetical protein
VAGMTPAPEDLPVPVKPLRRRYVPTTAHPHFLCRYTHRAYLALLVLHLGLLLFRSPEYALPGGAVLVASLVVAYFLPAPRAVNALLGAPLMVRPRWVAAAVGSDLVYVALGVYLVVCWLLGLVPGVSSTPAPVLLLALGAGLAFMAVSLWAHHRAIRWATPAAPAPVAG